MRDKRIWYPGATYHVMSRGIRRLTICKDEIDYEIFRMVLKRTKEKLPFKLHSFCMMTNESLTYADYDRQHRNLENNELSFV